MFHIVPMSSVNAFGGKTNHYKEDKVFMKTFLRGIVIPVVSISAFLIFAIQAKAYQNQQTNPQLAERDATTAVPTTPERPRTIAPESPKVIPAQPVLELSVTPHPSKINERIEFKEPVENGLGAPRKFKATAYSLRGRTASGIETGPGVVAADPRVLPLGSLIEIKAGSYSGVYTVHDTGSAVKGNMVDVWMPSSKEARRFGRRSIKLHVLRYGPSANQK